MTLILARRRKQSVVCSTDKHGDQFVTVTDSGKDKVRIKMPDDNSVTLHKNDSYEFNLPPYNVVVTMLGTNGNSYVKLGLDAQDSVIIHREEVFRKVQADKEDAA